MSHDVILYHMISYDIVTTRQQFLTKILPERVSNPEPVGYEKDARPLNHRRLYKSELFRLFLDSCALFFYVCFTDVFLAILSVMP